MRLWLWNKQVQGALLYYMVSRVFSHINCKDMGILIWRLELASIILPYNLQRVYSGYSMDMMSRNRIAILSTVHSRLYRNPLPQVFDRDTQHFRCFVLCSHQIAFINIAAFVPHLVRLLILSIPNLPNTLF